MNTQTTLSITEARKKIFDIASDVQTPDRYYVLTENGKPKVVIMSAEGFEGWLETMEILSDTPDIIEDVKRLKKAVKSNDLSDYIPIEIVLNEYGYVVNEKVSHPYVSSHRTKPKVKKRA